MKNITPTQWFLIAIFLVIGYWIFSDGDQEEKKRLSTAENAPIGISDSLDAEAIARLGVDLTEHLNPELIPALIAEAMKETSSSGVGEADFVRALVSNVSNKIKDISTIDLNNDGLADPVIVIPKDIGEGQEFLQLSILVPDPNEVSTYPSTSDQEAWRDIVENKSIEIMTASAIKQNDEKMVMQSTPNPQMYQQSGSEPRHYHHESSLSSILMTSMMMHYLFTPRFYGFGYMPYGGYTPAPVTTVQRTRVAKTANLSKAQPSVSAAKTVSGKDATSSFKKTPTQSLNQIKTSQYKARNSNKALRSGGFGQSSNSNLQRSEPLRTPQKRTYQSPSRKSFGGSRSFGGSKRSFGGFRRR
ncbi:hypothetical protein WDW89_14330 [Deltaproteobacteria bacterium TL4]